MFLLATGLLCSAIMSDHWEEVSWNKEALKKLNISPTWYLDGQVAMLGPAMDHTTRSYNERQTFLVPMHGGIWTMCVTLTGNFFYSNCSDKIQNK